MQRHIIKENLIWEMYKEIERAFRTMSSGILNMVRNQLFTGVNSRAHTMY